MSVNLPVLDVSPVDDLGNDSVDDSVETEFAELPRGVRARRKRETSASHRASRAAIGAALASFVLIVLVGMILLGVVWYLGAPGTQAAPIDPATIDMEASPDLLVGSTIVGERGDAVDAAVRQQLAGLAPTTGSAVHLATFQTEVATSPITSKVYTWEYVDPADGPVQCLGWAEGGGAGGAACGPIESSFGPSPYWSMTDGTAGTSYSVLIDSLPADAVEAVAVTATGRTVKTNVVSGIAFLAWPHHEGSGGGIIADGNREFGPPLALFILDGNSQQIDRFDYTP